MNFIKIIILFLGIVILSCENNTSTSKEKNMKSEINDASTLVLKELNWWVEQSYNPESGEIESTGEAQAAIKNYLSKLDSMKVKYVFEKGKYLLDKRHEKKED